MVDRNMTNDIYDTIIIGGGPSGLLAAYHLVQSKRKILIIEQGSLFENRVEDNEEDVSMGIGGAGLFSDGKFSYYPSATELWNLGYDDEIKESYNEVLSIFSDIGVELKSWDSIFESLNAKKGEGRGDYQKFYESEYIDIKKRIKFINNVCTFIGYDNIISNTEVISVKNYNNYYEVKLNNTDNIIKSNTVIYAAGKYGSYNLRNILNTSEIIFNKYEVGIRIEINSKSFKPYNNEQTDYKYIKTISPGIEVRTFCCCRDGKVVKSKYHKFESFNGSSDTEKTGKSNIGVNLRLTDAVKDSKLMEEVAGIIEGKHRTFKISFKDFLNNNTIFLGKNIDSIIKIFIKEVFDESDDINAVIYGPTIEGIGFYPKLEHGKLKLNNEAIWIPGDSSGIFRGLAAALISGVYVGKCVETFLVHNEQAMIKQLNIKSSSTKEMKLVFTAQSKVFFYCRDAVCEFVLKNGFLPINPFRIFDYFLGDRVDRNLIRRGNNQLIRTCSELWVFGPISDGVLFEVALARKLRIPIRFYSIGTKIEEIYKIDYDNIIFEPEVHAKQIKRDELIRYIRGGIVSFSNNEQIDNKQLEMGLGDLE